MTAYLAVAFLVLGALALEIAAKALSAQHGQFPCSHPILRWMLRIYALAIVNRAAVLFSNQLGSSPAGVDLDIFLGALAMCMTHLLALAFLLFWLRLPSGSWAKLELRYKAERAHLFRTRG